MATAAMRPGPPEPSCRRPPRRQPRLIPTSLQVLLVLMIAAVSSLADSTNTIDNTPSEHKVQPKKASREPLNLTVGYLTALKGELIDRKGLAISGAVSIALKEVSSHFYSHFDLLCFICEKLKIILAYPSSFLYNLIQFLYMLIKLKKIE